MSVLEELMWAIIGLLLTIISNFIEAFAFNPPWYWSELGIQKNPLGVSFQIAAVLLTGCLGGKNAGAISQIAYLIFGLYWFPIFSTGGSLDYLTQPNFGYLFGFIPAAIMTGWLAFRSKPQIESLAIAAFSGLGIIHLFGIFYLLILKLLQLTPYNLLDLIQQYSFKFLPGQLATVCLVALLAFVMRKCVLFY